MARYRLDRLEVDGFWGDRTLEISFFEDVTILIGMNGSGKTTAMNLMSAVLRGDVTALASLEFQQIRLWIRSGRSRRKLTVTRDTTRRYDTLVYRVSRTPFEFDVTPRFLEATRRGFHGRFDSELQRLHRALNQLLRLSSLSVHRLNYERIRDPEFRDTRRFVRPLIDIHVEDLIGRLIRYQLRTTERTARVSADFQRDVVRVMLYNEKYDKFGNWDASAVQFTNMEENLRKVYRDLVGRSNELEREISDHFDALRRSAEAFRTWQETRGGVSADDLFPMPLMHRTAKVVELSFDADQRRAEIFAPLDDYRTRLQSFIRDKDVRLSTESGVEFERAGSNVDASMLSSGEKQIFVLLTEALLQEKQRCLFLADEPELSLHIEWQAMIVSALRDLNPNAQLTLATHSPEIAGAAPDNLVSMEDALT